MTIKPFDSNTTIILVGNFNPLIFKPSWFAKNEIIGEEEAENAEIDVIHSELVKFSLTWLTIVVEKNRFLVEVKQPPEIRIYDFVLKTFGEILIHTPIWAMGINTLVEFDAGSVEKRNQIGYTLAPIDAWGEWAPDLKKKRNTDVGGMVSLTMKQTVVDDRPVGFIQTSVKASPRTNSMVIVEVNDHYSIESPKDVEGCAEIISFLRKNYEGSVKRSLWIIKQVMDIAK